jgi:GH43 family beta-xylosidase
MRSDRTGTYHNPVYPHSFPDPFVLKCMDGFFAYCTGFAESEDEVFRVLASSDLVQWNDRGFAMRALASAPPYYWAPEVSYWNGQYFLYYSAGNEALMEIRVAVSERPDGGFVDAGRRLTFEDFAIDPHVFTDRDGSRYMFYATDFLEHTHIGTGTVVDRMIDPFTLAGEPRPVTRARYDWQVYDPNRAEKGGVRWHTVEGPAVFERKGTYFQMFSGGNWQNTTYGVSFASSASIQADGEWEQHSDGNIVLPLLRTLPGEVIGPGHNSIVRGPNNRELYCVYHRWTDAGRVMAIDRMDAVGERLFVRGPTTGPQPAPHLPATWAGNPDLGAGQSIPVPPSFLLACYIRSSSDGPETDCGLIINGAEKVSLREALQAADLDPTAFHELTVEADGRLLNVTVDGWFSEVTKRLESVVHDLCFYAEGIALELRRMELTSGFEDLCRGDEIAFGDRGWQRDGGSVVFTGREYILSSAAGDAVLSRRMRFDGLDFAVNISGESSQNFGLRLLSDFGTAFELAVRSDVRLTTRDQELAVPLPRGWETGELHQYQIVASGGRLTAYAEAEELAAIPFCERSVRPAIFCTEGEIMIEMVRASEI